jgi:hypothetical protein
MYKLILRYSVKTMFLLFLLFISTIAVGQTENDPSKYVPNIIPPSPTAYALGTYGNTPIGLFTGSQNVNIPLYTYKTANLEVPITMFYSSNGIKVDEISSNVGQSWNLSFGGVITRVVRDKPDEERGQYPIPISITEGMGRYSPQALEFYQYIGENDVDSEADLFSFNFGKYSGKFVFDNDEGIVLMPAQEFQIHCTISSDGFDFVITTPDGVKYYFNDKEITSQRVVGGGHSIPNITVSSWYLSKIVHPKGDEIQFLYEDEGSAYTASQSQTFRILSPRIQYDAAGNLENYSEALSLLYDHSITLSGKSIKSIKSTNSNYGEVLFTYLSGSSADVTYGNRKIDQITVKGKSAAEIDHINFAYTTTTNKRVFLDKIQFKDPNQNYQFEYGSRNSLPQRLSLSQDHWGYYNGKTNHNLVPKNIKAYDLENIDYDGADKEPNGTYAQMGLLKKITYPTKGYTTFDYESNDYYGEIKVLPAQQDRSLSVDTADSTFHKTVTSRFISLNTQDISFSVGVSLSCTIQSTDAGKSNAYVSVFNNTAKRYETLRRADNGNSVGGGDSSYTIKVNTPVAARILFFTAESGSEYTFTLTVNWQCTTAGLNYSYYPSGAITVPQNVATGGVRVKQVSDYAVNKPEPIIKRFYYAKRDDLQKSTGNKGQEPYYIDRFRVDRIMNSPVGGIFGVQTSKTYLNLSSSSLVSLFDTGSSNVFYKYVTISYGNNFLNGGEEQEFIVHRDAGDGFVIGTYEIRGTPLTNLGWDNGLLKRVDYFNKDGKTIKETINTYEEKTDFRKEVISYSARKNYEKIDSAPVNYACTQADLTKETTYITCITNHKHVLIDNNLIHNIGGKSEYECIAPGHNNVTTHIKHPCNGATLPKTISNLDNIDNLSIVSYNSIGFWHYLKSSEDIIYDVKGLNPISTITSYNYKGLNHIQLSSQTAKNSNQETIEINYFYAADPEMASKPFVSELAAKNMLAIPLDTQMYKAGNKLSEQLTIYDKGESTGNLLLPKSIYTAKFPNVLPEIQNIGSLEKKITFDQYDDKGNILQYTLESGTPVAVIWGYGKTQPIAKIENVTYSAVSGYVSNLQTKSDTATEADLLTDLNSLRVALPNAMVTTYTYQPLIGISTITDPKGNTTTYLYDDFNRLKIIKDGQGHIVSENQYHYKTKS